MAGCPLRGLPAGAAYAHRYVPTSMLIGASGCVCPRTTIQADLRFNVFSKCSRMLPLVFFLGGNKQMGVFVFSGCLKVLGHVFQGQRFRALLFRQILRECQIAPALFFSGVGAADSRGSGRRLKSWQNVERDGRKT